MKFEEKSTVVTGAGSDMGWRIAFDFVKEGEAVEVPSTEIHEELKSY